MIEFIKLKRILNNQCTELNNEFVKLELLKTGIIKLVLRMNSLNYELLYRQ